MGLRETEGPGLPRRLPGQGCGAVPAVPVLVCAQHGNRMHGVRPSGPTHQEAEAHGAQGVSEGRQLLPVEAAIRGGPVLLQVSVGEQHSGSEAAHGALRGSALPVSNRHPARCVPGALWPGTAGTGRKQVLTQDTRAPFLLAPARSWLQARPMGASGTLLGPV